MLDENIQIQLKDVFSRLTQKVILRASQSSHPAQYELVEMLQSVSKLSEKIHFEIVENSESEVPFFEILGVNSKPSVAFRGVPGGHEFSSLVLAILNQDGQGKFPDEAIIARIKALKGPIRIQTFVSLSCENCPEVVQTLNLMATLHPDFYHETIDGAVAQSEVEALGLQGVPSIIVGDSLIHSGKAQFIDLLSTLESTFGKAPIKKVNVNLGLFDVAVIGAGPAGASSAIYISRKGLKTAIVAERLGGQLQETKGIENMISVSYTEGSKLAAQLSEHISQYPVSIFEHRRVCEISGGEIKRIELESGEYLEAKAVIIATGAKWKQLGIPGEKEYIGQGVAFCAHCDGPFYKGKKVVVVGGGNSGVEAAIDLAGIVQEVTLLEFTAQLKADDFLIEKLNALTNTTIITSAKSIRVVGDSKKVSGLEYQDLKTHSLKTIPTDGVFIQIGMLPNSQFVKDLVELTPHGEIAVDSKGHTNVPGIYAAGDVTTIPFKQIVIAMGEGAKVGLAAFEDRLLS